MKKIFLSILTAGLISSFLVAEEYQYRSEFIYCNLNDGKTIDDAVKDSKEYGEFVKQVGSKYKQYILVPMHAGETKYDYILWGTWPDGQAMYEEWGSYLNDFDESFISIDEDDGQESAGKCYSRIAMFNNGVTYNKVEKSLWDKRTPIQFAGCKLKSGATLESVHESIIQGSQKAADYGFSGWGRNTFVPYMGFNQDYPYDFVDMIFWSSFKSRGFMAKNYQDYINSNPGVDDGYSDLASCGPSKSFYVEKLFSNF